MQKDWFFIKISMILDGGLPPKLSQNAEKHSSQHAAPYETLKTGPLSILGKKVIHIFMQN